MAAVPTLADVHPHDNGMTDRLLDVGADAGARTRPPFRARVGEKAESTHVSGGLRIVQPLVSGP